MTDMPSLPPLGPAYRIETERLVIRCWQPADAPALLAAITASLEHLRPWMPWAAYEPTDLHDKVNLLRRFRGQFDLGADFTYGIFNRSETAVWGGCGLHTRQGPDAREIGYWIHAEQINKGLATEMAAALTKVAFTVDSVKWVEIRCDPANARSARVPEKLGFTHEATLRGRAQAGDGSRRDAMVWAMLAAEYPGSPVAAARVTAFDALGRVLGTGD